MKISVNYNILFLLCILFAFSGCKSPGGELTGVSRKGKYLEPTPYGMVLVPRGSFHMGPSDQEINSSFTPNRRVSVESFWMDETEITNSEYRQFVYWVKDSIVRKTLGETFDEYLISEDKYGNPVEPPVIDWNVKIDRKDPEVKEAISDLYYQENDRLMGEGGIDPRRLNYDYSWVDIKQAARKENMYNFEKQSYEGYVYNLKGEKVPITGRSSFIMRDMVNVYPDTLCWIRDFNYSYNEPWALHYFSHPGFDDYPVVGVSWKQAKAFCIWRTNYHNNQLSKRGDASVMNYRLPSEAEWEYAARGGKENSLYPWGGRYTRDSEGCFMANFKPMRGDYSTDGGMSTMQVATYEPNGYGLYDMSGNVAEWTITAFDETAYNFIHDSNPNYEYNALPSDPPAMKRKVIRGGSWKDIAYFLQVGTRTYEYQDTTKSYIGFRCVRTSFRSQF